MSTKSSECWTIDPQAHGLRVGVTSERSLTLPYGQFAFAELITGEKEQCLKILFATHEVFIHGQNLRRLEIALQRLELAFITAASTNYEKAANPGQPLILIINVTDIIPPKKQLPTMAEEPD
jgi:hypothetical protein